GSVVRGTATAAGKTVFVFPGQGSQWLGMGIELLDTAPAFAHQIDACAEAFAEFVDWSLVDVLRGAPGAPGLDRVDVVQPVLFAVMVSLAELWKSVAVHPDAVIGHSQGEIAAAYVAGALSLRDAARVVTLRSKLLAGLAGPGGMVSIACGADQARDLLAPFGDRVSIAVVNGPSAVVVSGEVGALEELIALCSTKELRTRRIEVDYASHSVEVEAIRGPLAEALSGIEPRSTRTVFFSTVTGNRLDTAGLDADYWYRNVRQTVLFDQAVRNACEQGHRTFIESSPHPALITGVEETFAACTDGDSEAIVVPTLGRGDGGLHRFLLSAASAFVAGVAVNWRGTLDGAGHVELPTYAFDKRRFWLSAEGSGADAFGLGLGASEHPLLGAVVDLPASGGVVLTGRLSPNVQPWLADHAVSDVVLFPGTGFVELAIRAGDEVGCSVLDELTLAAPLLLPATGSVAVQVVVDAGRDSNSRGVSIFSRADAQAGWLLHAEGILRPGSVEPGADLSVWPPAGAVTVDVADGYERLATCGYRYGPAFRGLTAMWARGEEIFAEVTLPEAAGGVGGFGVHPALLDAVLHAVVIAGDPDELALPFAWQGVSLHATGASAVRARIAPAGPSAVSVELADGLGLPVLSVASMVARPVTERQLLAAVSGSGPDRLFEVIWSRASGVTALGSTPAYQIFESVAADQDPVAGSYVRSHQALAAVQSWLTDHESGVLVVATRGAMALPREDVADLAGAAVWGLVRSAQTEHPGRIVLVDSDAATDDAAIAMALATGEPQVVLRGGQVYTARVRGSRAADAILVPPGDGPWRLGLGSAGTFENLRLEPVPNADAPLGPGQVRVAMRAIAANFRDIMITLGMFTHDALLGGEGAGVVVEVGPGVTEFSVGDSVFGFFPDGSGTLVAGDVRLLLPMPADWSYAEAAAISAVFTTAYYAFIHLADVQPGQRVLIHAGTGGVGMAAVQLARHLGSFLDALAAHRRAHGLPAISLGWGLWEKASAMTGGLDAADLARLGREGVLALSTAEALELFDTAMIVDEPFLAPACIDLTALRAHAVAVPPMFADLVSAPTRRQVDDSVAAAKSKSALAHRLHGLPEAEQHAVLLDLVRSHIATVLGNITPEAIDPDKAFQDLGFDSLTAVEMRNRLKSATGLSLSPTLIFDYPTPNRLASYIRTELAGLPQEIKHTPAVRTTSEDPIAIVGMACRYPGGVNSPDDMWDMLIQGRDVLSEFPGDRGWDLAGLYNPDPDAAGACYTRTGGFVDGVGDFDPAFFGVGPSEALAMDPQQRMLLELSWEALERAGIDPTGLRGSATGVFAGVMTQGYGMFAAEPVEGFRLTGQLSSVASGRVAYVLGLEGPAVSVDTACSSSLVALHMAVGSLRSG
ncbi:acyltransferase domain-containing protein, partial [Mycobacterium canetti]|uniref:acyltransferase domain-containing protein n=2 Tax=Mycobacterium canetti TaxID=78331 RepID=UPI00224888C9